MAHIRGKKMTMYYCSICGEVHKDTDPMCPQVFEVRHLDWVEELRRRCFEAGYGGVLLGLCDVEGVDKNYVGFCRQKPHGVGPRIPYQRSRGSNSPSILGILDDLGIPFASASCHWAGFDRGRMTEDQREVLNRHARFNWVCERKGP